MSQKPSDVTSGRWQDLGGLRGSSAELREEVKELNRQVEKERKMFSNQPIEDTGADGRTFEEVKRERSRNQAETAADQ